MGLSPTTKAKAFEGSWFWAHHIQITRPMDLLSPVMTINICVPSASLSLTHALYDSVFEPITILPK